MNTSDKFYTNSKYFVIPKSILCNVLYFQLSVVLKRSNEKKLSILCKNIERLLSQTFVYKPTEIDFLYTLILY